MMTIHYQCILDLSFQIINHIRWLILLFLIRVMFQTCWETKIPQSHRKPNSKRSFTYVHQVFSLNSHNPVEQNIKVEEKYSLFSLQIFYIYMYLVLWLGWTRGMALLRLC